MLEIEIQQFLCVTFAVLLQKITGKLLWKTIELTQMESSCIRCNIFFFFFVLMNLLRLNLNLQME